MNRLSKIALAAYFFAAILLSVQTHAGTEEGFTIQSAGWHEDEGQLFVKVKVLKQDGTLFTLTPLVVEQYSVNNSVFFKVPLPVEHAIPCNVTVTSILGTKTVGVKNSPSACSNSLTISGTVIAGPDLLMANGIVTVTVGEAVFTTDTDSFGQYSIDIYSASADAMVTVNAVGDIGNVPFVLRTYAGTIGRLQGLSDTQASIGQFDTPWFELARRTLATLTSLFATPAYAQEAPGDITEILVSNVTTALAVAIDSANGNRPPASDEDVNDLVNQLNPEQVIELAATLTLVASGELSFQDIEGASNINQLLDNPDLASNFIEAAETNELLEAAVTETVANTDIFPSVDLSSVVGIQFEAKVGNVGINEFPAIFEFYDDGMGTRTGTKTFRDFTIAFVWSTDSNSNRLNVVYNEIRYWGKNLPFSAMDCTAIPNPPDPIWACSAELLSSEYSLIADALLTDAYSVVHTYQLRSDSNPSDVSSELTFRETTNFMEPDGLIPFESTAVPGTYGTGMPLYRADRDDAGHNPNSVYATVMSLDAGGTGTYEGDATIPGTEVVNPGFPDIALNWSVEDDGSLKLTSTTAPVNATMTLYQVRPFGPAFQTIALAEYMDETFSLFQNLLTPVDPELGFDETTAPGRYRVFQGAFAVADPFFLQFDPDGTGFQQLEYNGELTPPTPFGWAIDDTTSELVATYYRDAVDPRQRFAFCADEDIPDVCHIWRIRRVMLLYQDAEFNYIRNWQQFTDPFGNISPGDPRWPQAFIAVHKVE